MKKKILFGMFSIFFILFSVSFASAIVATTRYVATTGSDSTDCSNLAIPCKTITYAIGQAVSGDTVNVAAGTYTENVVITGKSNLIVQGAGITTVVEPASGIGFALTNSNSITIKNLKIHTTGTDAHGIWVKGTNSGGQAMSSLTVQDSTIIVDGYSSGIYSEESNPAHSGWLIGGLGHGNIITVSVGDGADLYDVSASEFSYNNVTVTNPTGDPHGSTNVLWFSELSDLSNLVFRNNIVSGSSGSEIAIVTDFLNLAPDTSITTVTVSGNTFSNWGSRALRLGTANGAGTVTGITINSNTFQMTADTTEVIGGTATDKTGTGNTFNVNSPAKIQKAIDSAFSGDTINVAAGTYTEDLAIPETKTNLNLAGAGKATTVIKGVTRHAIPGPEAFPNIEILASGVKIHDFTIEGPDYLVNNYATGMVIGAANVEIYNNSFKVTPGANGDEISQAIQTWRYNSKPSVDISGLNIHDNTFTHLSSETAGYEGIWINLDTGVNTATVQNNQFSGNIFRAITTERSKTTISNNIIITDLAPGDPGLGGWQGINIGGANGYEAGDTHNVASVSVTGNTIKGSGTGKGFTYGIKLGYDSAMTFNNVAITSNIIQGSGTGIWVKFTALGITVNNNNIYGNSDYGVKNDDSAILNAESNWWGSSTGPYHPTTNSGGLGDGASDNVDYTPWLTFNVTFASPQNRAYNQTNLWINISTSFTSDKIEYSADGSAFSLFCLNCSSRDTHKIFSEGNHTLIAKAILGSIMKATLENETVLNAVNFFVDSSPPKIIKTLPEDGATVHGTTFYIKYTEANLVNISLYWNSTPSTYERITNTTCQSGISKECTFDLDLNSYDGKNINYYFEVRDPANLATSSVKTITIDSTNPIVTINLPKNATYYSNRRINLDVAVSETVKKLEYSLDGHPFSGLCINCKNYNQSKTFSDGNHTLIVKATDYAGNTGQSYVNFLVDTKIPIILRQLPLNNKYTNGTFIIFYTEENLKNITLYYKGNLESTYKKQTNTTCESGRNKKCNFVADLTGYDNLLINYYFVVRDQVSEKSSRIYTENVDITKPTIQILYPVNSSSLSSRNVRIEMVVSEDVKLEYSDNDGTFRTLCNNCHYYNRTKTFEYGLHGLLIKATDRAGNVATTYLTFTINKP